MWVVENTTFSTFLEVWTFKKKNTLSAPVPSPPLCSPLPSPPPSLPSALPPLLPSLLHPFCPFPWTMVIFHICQVLSGKQQSQTLANLKGRGISRKVVERLMESSGKQRGHAGTREAGLCLHLPHENPLNTKSSLHPWTPNIPAAMAATSSRGSGDDPALSSSRDLLASLNPSQVSAAKPRSPAHAQVPWEAERRDLVFSASAPKLVLQPLEEGPMLGRQRWSMFSPHAPQASHPSVWILLMPFSWMILL